jgi:DNA end-binding protein Ku
MRAILNGQVTFGLVNVPVKVYGATDDHDIRFHQVHATDGGQIRYKRVCEECGEPVDMADIAKAYTEDDKTIIVTDDDLASLAEDRPIEVLEFVPANGIDPLMYEKSYYLGPNVSTKNKKSPAATRAYTLLTRVLMDAEQMAIVQFTLRSKTRLAALRVMSGKQDILVLHTLQWPDEVREVEFTELNNAAEVSDLELETGKELVKALASEGFNPDHYRDSYQEQLRELLDAKLRGETPITPGVAADAPEDVSDLLAKLQASLKK